MTCEGEIFPLLIHSPPTKLGFEDLDENIQAIVKAFIITGQDAPGRRADFGEARVFIHALSVHTVLVQAAEVLWHLFTGPVEIVDDPFVSASVALDWEVHLPAVLPHSAKPRFGFNEVVDDRALLDSGSGVGAGGCFELGGS